MRSGGDAKKSNRKKWKCINNQYLERTERERGRERERTNDEHLYYFYNYCRCKFNQQNTFKYKSRHQTSYDTKYIFRHQTSYDPEW